jgi:predicted SAM-dependent methyltransferase
MKLHLGCGARKIKGYIDIDIDEESEADIIIDVSTLYAIKDCVADEIKSQHLFEHFYYDDVGSILKNWYRVLKSGGLLSIECPDFKKCSELILSENPGAVSCGLYGVFGEAWCRGFQSEFLVHRCVWTAESLSKILKKAGFVNIKEVPTERKDICDGKGTYSRDMRIVACKPSI